VLRSQVAEADKIEDEAERGGSEQHGGGTRSPHQIQELVDEERDEKNIEALQKKLWPCNRRDHHILTLAEL
jgi:hypothetical protein